MIKLKSRYLGYVVYCVVYIIQFACVDKCTYAIHFGSGVTAICDYCVFLS